MFGKLKSAARHARIDRLIQERLRLSACETGANLAFRETEEGLVATIVLSESADVTGDTVKKLEAEISDIEGLVRATVVSTFHRTGPNQSGPSEARVRSGHDNPLALPGRKPSSDNTGQTQRPAKQRPKGVKRVLAIASGKGGVGKSTVAARLALALAEQGDRVGLLDLDIYGPSLPVLFDLDGVRPEVEDGRIRPLEAAGLSLMSIGFLVGEEKALAWRGPMVMGASKQLLDEVEWPELDWLVIDTPPGTGDAHLTLLQRTLIDGAVLISTPSPLAIADVRRGARLFEQMQVPIAGIVENMSSLPDGSRPFGDGIPEEELIKFNLPRLASLPLNAQIGGLIGRDAPPPDDSNPFLKLAGDVKARLEVLDHGPVAP